METLKSIVSQKNRQQQNKSKNLLMRVGVVWQLQLTIEPCGDEAESHRQGRDRGKIGETIVKTPIKLSGTLNTPVGASIPDSARIVSASSASRLPSAPLPATLRGPDPKLSGPNECAYHSGNVGEEEQTQMRAIFIRHRQSTGNAGIPCNDLALLELTELG